MSREPLLREFTPLQMSQDSMSRHPSGPDFLEQSKVVREQENKDKKAFEDALKALEATVTQLALQLQWDAAVRTRYRNSIAKMSAELRREATLGRVSWADAAKQASTARNDILEIMRVQSTPIGRATAEKIKLKGKTLNTLVAENTIKLFGPDADFTKLTPDQQNQVYKNIVESSGRSRGKFDAKVKNLSRFGKGIIVLSLAVSVYTVATAEDKGAAAKEEAAVLGAGVVGGVAGGAAAGLFCGPGAPVCSTIGAFVGGAAAAFGVSLFF